MDHYLVADLRKIPPITRFLCGSSLAVTIAVLMHIVAPHNVLFCARTGDEEVTGGGIDYGFDFIMLHHMADQLESGPYLGRSADLASQLLFACGSIIVATIPLRTNIFFRPLLVCLAYLSCALAGPGGQVSFMGFVTLPVKYFPYFMIGKDLLMAGPAAAAQSVAGAIVGHAWWWSVWGAALGSQGVLANAAQAPQWLKDLLSEGRTPRALRNAGARKLDGQIRKLTIVRGAFEANLLE
ncbi:uncharacterized protein LACBIDRAFT_292657 [Laccaria bicolor S238N-H82]|uniref:Derlin n=1 Tax=Laccaria bicolor (strain S238N-H82 / ATCC MYA-4686) TaxID=486041 RepID=B0CZA8_LACBS|nr:uncharacterized protein LACBIDRAFT_292657 [Laccaria bicolor S238N-H82]EDR12584.1 predicted protein [Laccaria bicolor S238N-H82]|eukprot:XP_001876848.1 predicted protein [Laccaria bicolor S238N-H82]